MTSGVCVVERKTEAEPEHVADAAVKIGRLKCGVRREKPRMSQTV